MKTINTKTIRIDGGTQSRVEINQDAVAEYAQAIKDGAELPPIVVFHDGADYWLADGFHRFHAHSAAGKASISADVRKGTQRAAVLFSCGANGTHGMRRTNADKRKAVLTLLQDAEWAKWSDGRIAKQCEVTPQYVGQVRSSLETVSSENPSKGRTYTTKHGTEAVMKTGSIGSKKPEPTPAPAPEIDSDKFNEALSAIDSLQEENERLTERLAVEAMDASEEEKTKAKELIDELRSKIKTLEAELSAVKVSRDTYMRENAELKKQCISQRKRIERLERDAEKAGEEF